MEKYLDKIICGDNIQILSNIPDESIDLIVTSPPYDNIRDYNGFQFNFEKVALESSRVLKNGGVIVWIIGDQIIDKSESLTSFKQALYFKENLHLNIHDTMIYEKSGFSNPSNNRYHQIFEYMFIISKGVPKAFNPIKDHPNKTEYSHARSRRKKNGEMSHPEDKTRFYLSPFGMRFNIWRYVTGKGNCTKDDIAYKHPAIFPEALVRDHILSWSNEGDIVLDMFNGSGTTTKMAKALNRHFIGIDISREYCDIAEQRLLLIDLEQKEEVLQSTVSIVNDDTYKKTLKDFFKRI